MEVLGRKSTILATSGPFILCMYTLNYLMNLNICMTTQLKHPCNNFFHIAWLLIGFATDVYMIYIARAIAGFCVGVASLSLPVYLAETVQPEVRGTLGK